MAETSAAMLSFDRRPVLLLLGLTALFYWKLVFSNRFTFLDSPDLMGQVAPWYQVQAVSWNQGVFPLWDPYVWAGQPLLGQMQPGAAFPLNWPLFAAPLRDGRIDLRWVHLHFGLLHLLPALFAFGLGRQLGLSRFPAAFVGLAFACGGYVGSVGWPQMLAGAIWLPATLLFFHRALDRGRTLAGAANAVLCGASVGMSLLSGHHQAPYFSLLALGGLAAWLAWRGERSARAGVAATLVVAGLAALLVAGLQLLPAFEYGREAYRWVNAPKPVGYTDPVPYNIHADSRLYPITLLGLVVPRAHFHVNTLVGWTALTLALYAAVASWSVRWVRVYAGVAVGATAFAFASFTPLHGWIYTFLPWAEKARNPAAAVFVAQLAVFVLAGFGVERLLARRAEEGFAADWLRWSQRTLVGFGALSWLTIYLYIPEGKMEAEPGDQMIVASLAAFALAAALEAWRRGRLAAPGLRFLLLSLLIVEMYGGQIADFSDIDDPQRQQHFRRYEEFRRVADFLHEEAARRPGERFRFELLDEGQGFNVGAWYGLDQVDGFLASTGANLYDFLSETGWVGGRMLLNTEFTVARERQRDEQILVYEDPLSEWRVWRNPEARPRVWVERDREHVPAGADPPGDCDGGVGDEARLGRYSPNRVLVHTRAACAGYLVLADPWSKGWRATVGGEGAEVYRYRGALRAVWIPAGESTVEFVYRPASVYRGAALTALGMLLAIVAGFVAWGESRAAAASR